MTAADTETTDQTAEAQLVPAADVDYALDDLAERARSASFDAQPTNHDLRRSHEQHRRDKRHLGGGPRGR